MEDSIKQEGFTNPESAVNKRRMTNSRISFRMRKSVFQKKSPINISSLNTPSDDESTLIKRSKSYMIIDQSSKSNTQNKDLGRFS